MMASVSWEAEGVSLEHFVEQAAGTKRACSALSRQLLETIRILFGKLTGRVLLHRDDDRAYKITAVMAKPVHHFR